MQEELKPCPFCGDENPEMIIIDRQGYVSCPTCSVRTAGCFEPFDNVALVARIMKQWNTRAEAEGKE